MNVAIIPARGGSKRIPRKNLRIFAGKPIIGHSISAAKETNLFSKIIVTTDDLEIAEVARSFGALVPFIRSAELADDFATTDAVLIDALQWLRNNDVLPDYFCCIYATAPFVTSHYLQRGYELLCQHDATTAFSVTTFSSSIFRALQLNQDKRIVSIWPENTLKRSQDLPDAYYDAGQFYWGDTRKYLAEKRLFSSDAVPVIIPRFLTQDIDTPEDWETAELMYSALHDIKWKRG